LQEKEEEEKERRTKKINWKLSSRR